MKHEKELSAKQREKQLKAINSSTGRKLSESEWYYFVNLGVFSNGKSGFLFTANDFHSTDAPDRFIDTRHITKQPVVWDSIDHITVKDDNKLMFHYKDGKKSLMYTSIYTKYLKKVINGILKGLRANDAPEKEPAQTAEKASAEIVAAEKEATKKAAAEKAVAEKAAKKAEEEKAAADKAAAEKVAVAKMRSLMHDHIVILGEEGHGKTTLTSAITSVLEKRVPGNQWVDPMKLENYQEETIRGAKINTIHTNYSSYLRRYDHVDFRGFYDCVKYMLTHDMSQTAAILVVAADEGVTWQTEAQLGLAKLSGITRIIVFLNKCDMIEDEEHLELIEYDICNMFDEEELGEPWIVRGSALGALEEPEGIYGDFCIMELLDELEDLPLEGKDNCHKPFLFPIEDTYSINGTKNVTTGRVERGTVNVNNQVEIVGYGQTFPARVTGVEMFHKIIDFAEAGDNVGLYLAGVNREQLQRGSVVAFPGSISNHTEFTAMVYWLDVGVKYVIGDRPLQIYLRTTDIVGECSYLPKGRWNIEGDLIESKIKLSIPMPVENQMSFSIRIGGRTIGIGKIISILN